jgi:protein-L-isoaspartate O-methyltransferase
VSRFPGTDGYDAEAPVLAQRYEALRFDQVHAAILHLLPTTPSRVLDIGAGTGRDAAALAALGHRVVAVEPTEGLRQAAIERHAAAAIVWIDDGLPALERVRALGDLYDVIMLTAVWMHLDAGERELGMDALSALLAPGGIAVFMLRHGPVPAGRRMFDVTWQETAALGARHGLEARFAASQPPLSTGNWQAGVTWSRGVLQRPA